VAPVPTTVATSASAAAVRRIAIRAICLPSLVDLPYCSA